MAEVEYSVYFVPVPIGNRADVTLRALDVLRRWTSLRVKTPAIPGFCSPTIKSASP